MESASVCTQLKHCLTVTGHGILAALLAWSAEHVADEAADNSQSVMDALPLLAALSSAHV